MHELSICQSLLQSVALHAKKENAQKVDRIYLQVGVLSGVEADLLQHAFSIAKAGTIAQEAELIIEHLPVKIRCLVCQQESEVAANKLLCKHCNAWQTEVIQGEEMLLRRIEMDCL